MSVLSHLKLVILQYILVVNVRLCSSEFHLCGGPTLLINSSSFIHTPTALWASSSSAPGSLSFCLPRLGPPEHSAELTAVCRLLTAGDRWSGWMDGGVQYLSDPGPLNTHPHTDTQWQVSYIMWRWVAECSFRKKRNLQRLLSSSSFSFFFISRGFWSAYWLG